MYSVARHKQIRDLELAVLYAPPSPPPPPESPGRLVGYIEMDLQTGEITFHEKGLEGKLPVEEKV